MPMFWSMPFDCHHTSHHEQWQRNKQMTTFARCRAVLHPRRFGHLRNYTYDPRTPPPSAGLAPTWFERQARGERTTPVFTICYNVDDVVPPAKSQGLHNMLGNMGLRQIHCRHLQTPGEPWFSHWIGINGMRDLWYFIDANLPIWPHTQSQKGDTLTQEDPKEKEKQIETAPGTDKDLKGKRRQIMIPDPKGKSRIVHVLDPKDNSRRKWKKGKGKEVEVSVKAPQMEIILEEPPRDRAWMVNHLLQARQASIDDNCSAKRREYYQALRVCANILDPGFVSRTRPLNLTRAEAYRICKRKGLLAEVTPFVVLKDKREPIT